MKKVESLLLVLMILLSTFALAACGNNQKQVPVYEGMTVSSVTELAEIDYEKIELFANTNNGNGNNEDNGNHNGHGDKDGLNPEGCDYYADLGEDIYINIHINNPDNFEILSFTFNGEKYSDYMFEDGSNMESIIIKINVGRQSGLQEHTIDAIKYVDGTKIKDVIIRGNQTISVHVSTNEYVGSGTGDSNICKHEDTTKIVFLKSKPATCIETGLTEGQLCTMCGEYLVAQQEIPLTTHTYDNKYDENCNVCNYERDVECGHFDVEVIEGSAPTCTTIGISDGQKCKKCGEIVVAQYTLPMIGCIESNWIVDKEATKTEDGFRYTECTMCKKIMKDEVLPATGSLGLYINGGDLWGIGTCTDTEVVIPNTVRSIPNSPFQDCATITNIVIPETITYIGLSPFLGCTSLINIEVDENNKYYESIDGNLYTKGGGVLIQYALGKKDTTFTIPNTVADITTAAFNGCTSLTSVVINISGVIGSGVFDHCSSLTSVTIGNTVTYIGGTAFGNCPSLTDVQIGNSVRYIDISAFLNCTSLVRINYEGTVEEWNAINKYVGDWGPWDDNTGDYTVYCTDGQIAKDGTITYK